MLSLQCMGLRDSEIRGTKEANIYIPEIIPVIHVLRTWMCFHNYIISPLERTFFLEIDVSECLLWHLNRSQKFKSSFGLPLKMKDILQACPSLCWCRVLQAFCHVRQQLCAVYRLLFLGSSGAQGLPQNMLDRVQQLTRWVRESTEAAPAGQKQCRS